MNKKLFWGLGILMLFIGTVFVFITLQDRAEIRQLEKELAAAKELEKHMNQQPSVDNKPPQEARDGFKWEWHGDHWHEMPVAQVAAPTPIVQPVQVKQPEVPTHTGPLTYHEELLKTNPVKALRLQSEERGHWSAEHIPPFPPDDTEAQEYARSQYLLNYYESIGMLDTPIYQKVALEYLSQKRAINAQFPVAEPVTARQMDLWRITWTHTDAGEITPYGGMTRFGRARMFLSDYFPDFIDVPE